MYDPILKSLKWIGDLQTRRCFLVDVVDATGRERTSTSLFQYITKKLESTVDDEASDVEDCQKDGRMNEP